MIYLDNGATSFPKPRIVHEEYERCMRFYAANAGRGAHKLSMMAAEKMWEARTLLATLFHIALPERIAFTENCTAGLNIGLRGILKSGDDLIISDMEHNSVYRPAMALAKNGVKTLFAVADAEGMLSPQAIEKQITPRTRMVCLQHASNVGGGINPIAEIGKMLREKGILFMVDAAQTAGCVPIDVEKDCIDILAFPGHKGLLGPQGTGGIYIRPSISVEPLTSGGTGSESESPAQPDFLPDRLESGTQNLPGIAGLCGGLRYVLSHGVEAISRHEVELCTQLASELQSLKSVKCLGPADMQKRVGVLSLQLIGKDPSTIAGILNKNYNIAVRAGLHCAPLAAAHFGVLQNGSLRFSPGVFNTSAEIDYAARALREIINSE
ncbi:MAG: aminotransferase class V-fold PLP-dependent enzyme [Clostridia bacterium]|nr:aminotransferase class V-fold PLP-dependent enzyme [Clostridia bacterium]